MYYAVHYAGLHKERGDEDESNGRAKKLTTVVSWSPDVGPTKTTLPKEPEEQRKAFVELLSPADSVYIPTGGGADYFVLACHTQGARVLRLPTCRLAELRKQNNEAENGLGELAREGMSAELVHAIALARPEWFLTYEPLDVRIAQLRTLGRMYKIVQNSIRKPGVQRLRTPVRGMEILGDATASIAEFAVITQESFAQSIFGDLHIPGANIADSFERIMKNVEKEVLAEVQKIFRRMPLWNDYIGNIPGVGPSIGSRLIGEIGDVRLFPTEAHLWAYAGINFTETGRRVRRRVGQVSNWSPQLKQVVYDFSVQTLTKGRQTNPWRQALDWRRQIEEAKQPGYDALPREERSYPAQRAMSWLGQRFLRHVYSSWWRYLESLPYREYDFECLRTSSS